MEQTRLFELLLKRKEGIINLDEQLELKRLMSAYTSTEVIEEYLNVLFDHRLVAEGVTDPDSVERSLEVLNKKLEHTNRAKRLNRWRPVGIAAAAIFLVGIGLFGLFHYMGSPGAMQVVSTKGQSKTSLVLPDGSKVWINEKTVLRFSNDLGREQREVYLEGEAYFDIVKNKNKPFVVHTRNMDVRVLGTEFNVRAYGNEYSSETTLIRGRVEVLLNQKKEEKVVLHPNEKLVIQNKDGSNRKRAAESGDTARPVIAISKVFPNGADSGFLETQWLKDNIRFDQQPLKTIIPMLEKWYGITIVLHDPSLGEMRFSGKIDKETLPEVLESFKLSGGIQYRMDKDTVIIR
ncbi:FecR family protein [Niabella beijingensis]|uniref:FecR family protein n=1 Tax=Niabella beijingensis TaxID=2872700 RepID=UPI001CC12702|nr:FecR domain-containing protein [Niabella beijingensis]MBZ4192483.1 DUF4974 domain-containing protein [Niabella beijingensis]